MRTPEKGGRRNASTRGVKRKLGKQKPESGVCLECTGNSGEASGTGAERTRGYETREEVWPDHGWPYRSLEEFWLLF